MVRRPPHMDPDQQPEKGVDPMPQAAFRWRLTPSEESDPARVVWALRERIKELNCLYAIAQLAEVGDWPIRDILDVVVTVIIPPSWQYPEITCARISLEDETCKGADFKLTPWQQSAPIHVFGEVVGELTVCYLEERPPSYEGPFLHEERVLLDAIAERIGAIAMRIQAEQELQETNHQLKVEHQALQETNAALKTLMTRIEEEKREIYRDIRDNVEKVLMPILHELLIAVPKQQRKFVELLRDNLEEITSPFVSSLSQKFQSLTPTEIQVCNMIRNGIRTKEIAELRGISPATVNRHRERIRNKMGITNSDTNLTTFLRANMERS
jgi:DNA-binding CsgD family transcriptional regulator